MWTRAQEAVLPPSDSVGAALAFASEALATGPVRAPRLNVLVNGLPLTGATEASVSSAAYFSADRFRVQAALSGDAALWAAETQLFVDVQMALSPLGGFVSVVQGYADLVSIDPVVGTLMIEGRDLSAKLIEARTQETFANRTSSEIATILAGRHGLTANVQATTTRVGRYWELEHDSLTLNAAGRTTTEWDLLVALAKREGFDLWVSSTMLNFVPPNYAATPAVVPMSSVVSLRLERALTFAGDIVVTVKSWHSRAGSVCVKTAQTDRGAASSREYVYVVPNLTPDVAQTYAQNVLNELTRHELVASMEMPGELAFSPRTLILLQGTGTIFDTMLRIDEVERRLDATRGFTQRLRARAASAG
jgi:phage protein D